MLVKKGTSIDPIILGGGQEHGLRSGTENENIVGFGKACEIAKIIVENNIMKKLRDYMIEKVLHEIPEVTNGHLNLDSLTMRILLLSQWGRPDNQTW